MGYRMSVRLCVSALLLWVAVSFCSGYVYQQYVAPRPGHAGECWVESKGQFYKDDDTWNEDNVCEEGHCSGHGTHIERYGCGAIGASANCWLVTPDRSLGLPYPHCCPRIQCY